MFKTKKLKLIERLILIHLIILTASCIAVAQEKEPRNTEWTQERVQQAEGMVEKWRLAYAKFYQLSVGAGQWEEAPAVIRNVRIAWQEYCATCNCKIHDAGESKDKVQFLLTVTASYLADYMEFSVSESKLVEPNNVVSAFYKSGKHPKKVPRKPYLAWLTNVTNNLIDESQRLLAERKK